MSCSYDAASYFDNDCEDIKDMYRRITGKDLCLDVHRVDSDNDDED